MAHRLLLIMVLAAGLAGCDRPSDGHATPAASPPAAADAAAAAPASTADGRPVISFAATTHDFGVIDETAEVSTVFPFTNTGTGELVIGKLVASCGCTTSQLAKRRYQPGEGGEIVVSFNPTRPSQNQHQSVTVQANTDPPATKLTISANVTSFLDFDPKILQFGTREYGVEQRATMTVSCRDENFVIDSVTTNAADVTVGVVPPEAATAPGPKTIEVVVAPTRAWGPLYFGVDVTATGRPSPGAAPVTHTRNVRVAGRLFGKLSASPDMFRFAVYPGDDIDEEIYLKRTDGQPFRILKTEMRIPGLPNATVRSDPESLHEWKVTLSAKAGPTPLKYLGTVVVTTDVPGEEVIELGTLGLVQQPR